MKRRLFLGKVIGIIGFLIFVCGVSYIISYTADAELFNSVNLVMTYEDTKTFKIEKTDVLSKEDALKEYPYIFEIENKGGKTNYELVITDIGNDKLIDREDLNYILYLNGEVVGEGSLDKLNDNLLYNNKIDKKKKDIYKLFIYVVNKVSSDEVYEYEVKINVNK